MFFGANLRECLEVKDEKARYYRCNGGDRHSPDRLGGFGNGKDHGRYVMWYCFDCKEYFDTPEEKTEWCHSNSIGFDGMYPETSVTCPYCNSDDIEECKEKCDACGTEVISTALIGNMELCPDCKSKFAKIMDETADKIVGELGIDRLDAESLIGDWWRCV